VKIYGIKNCDTLQKAFAALQVALSALGIALLSGCAGYSPTVATDEKPTPKDTYLYGRFHILNPPKNPPRRSR